MAGNISSVMFPFNDAEVLALTATGAQALTINSHGTVIDGVSTPGTADRTLNLTPGSGLRVGAIVFVRTETTGTENTVFGTNVNGVDYAGVANNTLTTLLVYNGSSFDQFGAALNIDA